MSALMVHSPGELPEKAAAILAAFPGNRIFAVSGEMGAGKTTLIKAFGKVLGVEDTMSSPTFSLINEYYSPEAGPVYHFDLYRLEKQEDLYDIGYEEYVYSDNYCFLEWPGLIRELLPQSYVYINIIVMNNGQRRIDYKAVSPT